MCVCDLDPPEFFVQEARRARKSHVCDDCRCTIRAGECYQHIRGKWDGYIDSYRMCPTCWRLVQALRDYDECACIPLGESLSYAEEALHGIGRQPGWFAVARLVVDRRQARRRERAGENERW